jgi:hypothetical protein
MKILSLWDRESMAKETTRHYDIILKHNKITLTTPVCADIQTMFCSDYLNLHFTRMFKIMITIHIAEHKLFINT